MTKIIDGNAIELFQSGKEYFPALVLAIDGATTEIHLESYIFELDVTGLRVRDALVQAAQRGVKVHLLIDGFGSLDFVQHHMHQLVLSGVEVLVYRPDSEALFFKRQRLRRLHRKVVLIDNSIAFVGGINIIDDMNHHRFSAPRFDFAVSVTGPLVSEIYLSVKRIWRLISLFEFAGRKPFLVHPIQVPCAGDIKASFSVRDNLKHRREIESAYLAAIHSAKNEIILSSAYFLPGRIFQQALIDAACRGVHVVLLLQGRADHPFIHYAEHGLYEELMSGGVDIYEYTRSHLHAKVAVIDEYWATVGSSNLDPFSLLLAREANVMVYDQRFAKQLRQRLLLAIKNDSTQLSLIEWRNKKIDRFWNKLAYRLVRVLIGMTGYLLDYDQFY
ncbi:MAG: cardiolipin synthase ClsB [Proteobacteria bacterium]|nr:cardiolipin synthase ClsB [Pseudomonadota bacterium]MDE3208843.1 cardiolipin synthase ClsB [Pseudomonadota bacterium]